jgi:hypothetical protein
LNKVAFKWVCGIAMSWRSFIPRLILQILEFHYFERIKARVHYERRDCIISIHHREKKSIKSYKVVGKNYRQLSSKPTPTKL